MVNKLKSRITLFLIVSLIFISLPSLVLAKIDNNISLENRIIGEFTDSFFTEKMEQYYVPGVAIIIVKDGNVIFSNGYGYSNIEKGTVVNPEKTIFRVASVSKIFTITFVLQLEEQGLLNLDRDVGEYVKDFKIPVQKPGTMITYGGYGTALAGHLISQVEKQSFEDYIQENIFQPLGMNNSSFHQSFLNGDNRDVATIYNYDEEGNQFVSRESLFISTSPTGGLSTTAEDMGKFITALLNKGELDKNRILKESTVEGMFKTQYTPHPSFPGITYGFMKTREKSIF